MRKLCLNLAATVTAFAACGGAFATENLPPYNPAIDPANFVSEITNQYFPMKPGTVFKFEGTRDGVARRDEMTVTDETKVIMGVKAIVVRDVASSDTEIVEKTVDWYAQDKDGNVWYFGEDTAEFANGKVTNTDGTWMAGVDGAIPGIIMKAKPTVGDGYRQEYRPGVAEDYAMVINTNATAGGPTGKYENVVVTEDTDLLDKAKFEHKWFAPGIGPIGTDGMVGGHHEIRTLKAILKPQ
jgi:hypothetical protein